MELNKVRLTGKIGSQLANYSVPNRESSMKFGWLLCRRKSGTIDTIPFVVPIEVYRAVSTKVWENGIKIYGHIIKLPIFEGRDRRFVMVIFVESVFACILAEDEDINDVEVEGIVYKPPIYRITPLGRQITELSVLTPRNKRFIPVIAWERIAELASYYNVGDHIVVNGRFQSREYDKLNANGDVEKMLTFELSAFRLNRLK